MSSWISPKNQLQMVPLDNTYFDHFPGIYMWIIIYNKIVCVPIAQTIPKSIRDNFRKSMYLDYLMERRKIGI